MTELFLLVFVFGNFDKLVLCEINTTFDDLIFILLHCYFMIKPTNQSISRRSSTVADTWSSSLPHISSACTQRWRGRWRSDRRRIEWPIREGSHGTENRDRSSSNWLMNCKLGAFRQRIDGKLLYSLPFSKPISLQIWLNTAKEESGKANFHTILKIN